MFEKYIAQLKKKKPAPSRGRDRSKMEITPFRDWRTVVIAFFVSLFVVFGFNILMFININEDNFVTGELPQTSIAPLENNKLDNALSEITKRAQKFEEVRAKKEVYRDPSL